MIYFLYFNVSLLVIKAPQLCLFVLFQTLHQILPLVFQQSREMNIRSQFPCCSKIENAGLIDLKQTTFFKRQYEHHLHIVVNITAECESLMLNTAAV